MTTSRQRSYFCLLCILIFYLCFVLFRLSDIKILVKFDALKLNDSNKLLTYVKESCTPLLNKTTILTFEKLLNTVMDGSDFAVVVPNDQFIVNLNEKFCPLINLLLKNRNIVAAAGATVMPFRPVCTLLRDQWTIIMNYNFTVFQNNSESISSSYTGLCFACDLLPDVFVVNLHHLRAYKDKLNELQQLKRSAHLPFFLLLQGRSAYCPQIEIRPSIKVFQDESCNNLSSRWDEYFAFVPKVLNVFRLITPNGLEVWLGCVWMRRAYDLRLPIHCSNFVRQYLYDLVDIIVNDFKMDYRILWGTSIGAIRHKDVIPWTVDTDLYLISNKTVNLDDWRNLLKGHSSRLFSSKAKDGMDHYDPYRAFPMCPVLLTGTVTRLNNITRNNLISDILKENKGESSYSATWRSFGYVDIYEVQYRYLTECVKKYLPLQSELGQIGNRFFKTLGKVNDSIICEYGKEVFTTYPKLSYTDWQSFIEYV